MLTDRPLQIEVLVNSPGPHDQVRVREPFAKLQSLGVDCRIHERPFRFNTCIRPNSLVIWQRPLPESQQRQWEHLQWLRERGCLLLTEWDDHPDLFPANLRDWLRAQGMAPLKLCHGLHTSSTVLAEALRPLNPLTLVLDNALAEVPPLALAKHQATALRVFIGNQNRSEDQGQLVEGLQQWLADDQRLELVVLADQRLASALPQGRVRSASLLSYQRYREVMGQCHLALLPLSCSLVHACKTPIKLMECAAESVATVSGPELYGPQAIRGLSVLAPCLEQMVPLARELAGNLEMRLNLVTQAHRWAEREMSLLDQVNYRWWLYRGIWQRRQALDQLLQKRLAGTAWALEGDLAT